MPVHSCPQPATAIHSTLSTPRHSLNTRHGSALVRESSLQGTRHNSRPGYPPATLSITATSLPPLPRSPSGPAAARELECASLLQRPKLPINTAGKRDTISIHFVFVSVVNAMNQNLSHKPQKQSVCVGIPRVRGEVSRLWHDALLIHTAQSRQPCLRSFSAPLLITQTEQEPSRHQYKFTCIVARGRD